MLRSALAMLSSLRIGASIKDTVERKIRSAIMIAVAGLLCFVALMWGLVTAEFALLDAGFSGVQASGIIAVAVFLVAMLVLAAMPLVTRPHKSRIERAYEAQGPAGAVGVVDQQLGKVVQQVGPLSILVTAFAIGLAAGRKS